MKILLIEDEPSEARTLRALLSKGSPGFFDVEETGSIADARSRLAGGPVDAILYDLKPSGRGGEDTFERLKDLPVEIPVVVLTDALNEEAGERAIQMGAQDYLLKEKLDGKALTRSIAYAILRKRTMGADMKASKAQFEVTKTDFIFMVTHELNTPLAASIGALDLLRDGLYGELNPKQKQYVDILHANVERMIRLTRDLLDLTKMETGRFSIHPRPTPITQPLEIACRTLAPIAEGKGVDLVFSPCDSSRMVLHVDPDRIEQVFLNLIRNGIRYAKTRVDVSMEPIDAGCRVLVENDGPPIDREDMPKIFQKFYQGKQAPGEKKSGSGLGLAIVKGIVEAHGGTVEARNLNGSGVVFAVFLPKNNMHRASV